ncbi:MAG: GHKL domain-containing protein [Candidatus Omnitrophica bacterium]|nr:GHKL domain-containing protein [Candidatus Omnitrophota bacterium]
MPLKDPFVHKLLKRFDKVDQSTLKQCLSSLSEENALYLEILNRLQEGVILADEDGVVRLLNDEAALWLGIQDPAKPMNLLKDLGDSEVADFVREHWRRSERLTANFKVLSPRETWFRVFVIPLQSPKPKVLLLFVNLGESPEEKIAVGREEAVQALLSLAAGVAHEIGNPLNSIGIHLQLLKKQLHSPKEFSKANGLKTVQVLESETQRLDKIIRNFLKATRKPPLRFRTEDIHEILDEALEVLKPEFAQRKIKVEYRKDPELPHFLMDRLRLYQAFMNLMKNAIEAMPRAGTLKISVSHKEKIAVLRFQDQGLGITEKDLPHIFEAYYTTKEEGSGLGLAFVLSAVREHGGRIEVVSKAKKGTTFVLLLPIRQPRLQLPQYKSKEGKSE